MNTTNESKALENVMAQIGVIPNTNNSCLSQNLGNPSYPSGNSSHPSQNLVNPSCNKKLTINQQGPTSGQQAMTKLQQSPTACYPSGNPSYSSGNTSYSSGNTSHPCSNLVKSKLMPVNNSLILSEQGKTAKADLENFVATGKTKEFLGKELTFNDLDYMSDKDILKYYRLYQSAYSRRVNDTFSKTAIRTYARIASMCLPIADKDKLYEDMRSDHIIMSEIDKWTGWLAIKMGSLMAVASTSFITLQNVDYQKTRVKNDDNFSKINGGYCEETGAGNREETGTGDRNSDKPQTEKRAI